jgi:hypothetical protein
MTQVGQPENILNFVVAIAFLMIGVKTAIEVSQQASPKLGALANKVSEGGGPMYRFGLRPAARLAGRATARTAGALDNRLNLSGGASSALGSVAKGLSKVPFAGDALSTLPAVASARLGNVGNKRAEAAKGRVEGRIKGLDAAGQFNQLEVMKSSGNKEEREYATQKLAKLSQTKEGSKYLQDNAGYDKEKNADKKKAASSLAAVKQQRSYMEELEKIAKENDDQKLKDEIKEDRKKDPRLHSSLSEMYKEIANGKTEDIKPEAWGDFGTFMAYAKAKNLVGADGKLVAGYADTKEWKDITTGSGNRTKFAKAHEQFLQSAQGQSAAKDVLGGMNSGAKKDAIDKAERARYQVAMADNPDYMTRADFTDQGLGYSKFPTADVMGPRA